MHNNEYEIWKIVILNMTTWAHPEHPVGMKPGQSDYLLWFWWGSLTEAPQTNTNQNCYSLVIRQTMCRKDSANTFAVRILIIFGMFMAKKFSTSLSFLVDTLYNKKISINCSPQDRNFTTSTADGEKHHIFQFYLKKVFARVHNKAHSPRSLSHRRY